MPQLKSCTLIPVPEVEKWRIGVLLDAIDNLNDICSIEDFDQAMTKDIINCVCNSWKTTTATLKLMFYLQINDI